MKKSILALAVLGAFAGAASAQSSVTIYGKIDMGVGKEAGKADRAVMDAAGSRLGFRGVEDLGGGLKATFGFEHRFNPATGADATAAAGTNAKFWNGFSIVGLTGSFGAINLGRHYTPAFALVQNQIDPFGGDTVAGLRGVGMLGQGTVAKVRASNMIEYRMSASGFNFGAQIAEASANGGPDRPFSVAANYAAGPLFVGAGYENASGVNDKHLSAGVRYNFGFMTASLGGHKGTTNTNVDTKGYLLGASVPVGSGAIRAGWAQSTLGSAASQKKVSVGYRHDFSKRTYFYADLARVNDAIATTEKTGYDLGIQHNF